MLSVGTIGTWHLIHKWTSLVCTAFLLVICITGLPLLFREEINSWLNEDPPYKVLPADAPRANLDRLVSVARNRYPGEIVRTVFIDDDEPRVIVTLAPSYDALPEFNHGIKFDARSGELLKEMLPANKRPLTFIGLMLRLHTDWFTQLPGKLFLGVIGLLFVTSVVSGVMLYGPFMKKLSFGTVRRERTPHLKWLDLHNLLGIATLVWASVVGLTGFMNQLSDPLFDLWRNTEVKHVLASYRGRPMPVPLSPVQDAYNTVSRALPRNVLVSVVFPQPSRPHFMGSSSHYLIWTKGNTPLTSRLFTPALVDAQTGQLTTIGHMPWYLRTLEVSRPLHFGDYGGLPLKILWALLDLITIGVLTTGIYLWVRKRKVPFEQQLLEDAEFDADEPTFEPASV